MSDVIGIAWFKDENTYRRAREIFTDSEVVPATFEDWRAIVKKELEEIKRVGNTALRVDIDPQAFVDWCYAHGHRPDSLGRTAFVNHIELEYRKTGKGKIIK